MSTSSCVKQLGDKPDTARLIRSTVTSASYSISMIVLVAEIDEDSAPHLSALFALRIGLLYRQIFMGECCEDYIEGPALPQLRSLRYYPRSTAIHRRRDAFKVMRARGDQQIDATSPNMRRMHEHNTTH